MTQGQTACFDRYAIGGLLMHGDNVRRRAAFLAFLLAIVALATLVVGALLTILPFIGGIILAIVHERQRR
jgi:hypothetical protein